MPTLPLFDPTNLFPNIPDTSSVVNDVLLDNLGDEQVFKRVDKTDPNLIYIGYVLPQYDLVVQPPQEKLEGDPTAPVWKIKRITITGGEIVIDYAEGDKNYDKIWDDRATYAYS
jgi:hypothetical protein